MCESVYENSVAERLQGILKQAYLPPLLLSTELWSIKAVAYLGQ
ncbi:MAG: hypothetical protein AAFQ08_01505 [Bacteroidota bacterium]